MSTVDCGAANEKEEADGRRRHYIHLSIYYWEGEEREPRQSLKTRPAAAGSGRRGLRREASIIKMMIASGQ